MKGMKRGNGGLILAGPRGIWIATGEHREHKIRPGFSITFSSFLLPRLASFWRAGSSGFRGGRDNRVSDPSRLGTFILNYESAVLIFFFARTGFSAPAGDSVFSAAVGAT